MSGFSGGLTDDCKVYGFDYFDTIIYRTVEPEYIKKIWCKELKEQFDINMSVKQLYLIRRNMEAFLCRKSQKQGYDLEFKYLEMLRGFYRKLDFQIKPDVDVFYRKAYGVEYNLECRVQRVHTDILSEIDRLEKIGKRIICVSDFYMPARFFKELFKYHGLEKYIKAVYVSSDYLRSKRSGGLYDIVLDKEEIENTELCMSGDNEGSDYNIPRKKGIQAYHINRDEKKREYEQFRQKVEKRDYLRITLLDIYRGCNRRYYEDLTFSLYLFTDKLYTRLKQNGIKDVFFLSREGEFLKKIFDAYQERRVVGTDKICSHYLIVSRKSTYIASLQALDKEDFSMIFRQYVNISIYDFLSSLGIKEDIQEKIGLELNIGLREKITDFPNSQLYKNLRHNATFVEAYEEYRQEQRHAFRSYLDSFGINYDKEGMCIVDVGWKGTIQDNIFHFFQGKVSLHGMYIGLVALGERCEANRKEGLIFSCDPSLNKYFFVYDENRSVFEVMLGASHGSADHYEKMDDGVKVITSEKKEEKELFLNVIKAMQEKMLTCMERIDQQLVDLAFDKDLLEEIVADIHARLVFFPLPEQIDLFYNIYHYENFGVFEYTRFKSNKIMDMKTSLISLKNLLKERRVFLQRSFWGIIALKDSGLEFLIKPYGCYMYYRFFMRGIC